MANSDSGENGRNKHRKLSAAKSERKSDGERQKKRESSEKTGKRKSV